MTRQLYCTHGTFSDKCVVCIGERVDKLRGQLQNCVNHLERAKRKSNNGAYDDVIESANKALYETLTH